MDPLDKLESSIQRFVEAYRKLREEKEHLSGDLVLVGAELEQARETVRNLRIELEHYTAADTRYREFEARKDELREHIKTIIEKIDRYSDSDTAGTITNA